MAIKLLVETPPPEEPSFETRFGGNAFVNADSNVEWPTCEVCGNSMRFLGQIRHGDHLVLVFMCDDDSDPCPTWEPDNGTTATLVVAKSALKKLSPPSSEDQTTYSRSYGACIEAVDVESYGEAWDIWKASAITGQHSEILGLIGQDPDDEEMNDETCSCGNPMLLARLNAGGPNDMNFVGDGWGYVSYCSHCQASIFFTAG